LGGDVDEVLHGGAEVAAVCLGASSYTTWRLPAPSLHHYNIKINITTYMLQKKRTIGIAQNGACRLPELDMPCIHEQQNARVATSLFHASISMSLKQV
jgi:hypothetical protein